MLTLSYPSRLLQEKNSTELITFKKTILEFFKKLPESLIWSVDEITSSTEKYLFLKPTNTI